MEATMSKQIKVYRVNNRFFTSRTQNAEYVGRFELIDHPDANPEGTYRFEWSRFAEQDESAARFVYQHLCALENKRGRAVA